MTQGGSTETDDRTDSTAPLPLGGFQVDLVRPRRRARGNRRRSIRSSRTHLPAGRRTRPRGPRTYPAGGSRCGYEDVRRAVWYRSIHSRTTDRFGRGTVPDSSWCLDIGQSGLTERDSDPLHDTVHTLHVPERVDVSPLDTDTKYSLRERRDSSQTVTRRYLSLFTIPRNACLCHGTRRST